MSIITPHLHKMQTDETLDTHQHQLKCDLSPAHEHTVFLVVHVLLSVCLM